MELFSAAGTIIGVIGIIAGAAFYLKYVATKANIDGKDETISTLERQRDATKEENVTLLSQVSELTGENRTLKTIATQTPEIRSLTAAVTKMAETSAKQGKQNAEAQGTTIKLIKELIGEMKKDHITNQLVRTQTVGSQTIEREKK